MKAALNLTLDNEAFSGESCGSELARILRKLAERVDYDFAGELAGQTLRVHDANGNRVGELKIFEG